MRETFIQLAYIASSVLFILGLKGMTKVKSARQGNGIAALGIARTFTPRIRKI